MSSRATTDYDVIICGAGPSGSAMAAFLARAGRKVALFEQAAFPRHQIGESLLPHSWTVLKAIGADASIRQENYVRKHAAIFHSEYSRNLCRFAFRNALNSSHPYIYQVDRRHFDTFLRNHAVSCGAHLHQPERVDQVEKDADGVVVNGRYRAKLLVRASGLGTSQALPNNYVANDDEDNITGLYTYFSRPAVDHNQEENGDIHINLFYDDDDRRRPHWSWAIPISHEVWSVGLVMPTHRFARLRREGQSLDDMGKQLLARVPYVQALLRDQEPLEPFRMRFNFQRVAHEQYFPREFLIGDAAGFIDPVFSSGVHLGLQSAHMVAKALDKLDLDDTAALDQAGQAYGLAYRRMFWVYYRFVKMFYQRNVVENLFLNTCDLDDPGKRQFVSEFTSILAGDFQTENSIIQSLDRTNLTLNPHVRAIFAPKPSEG